MTHTQTPLIPIIYLEDAEKFWHHRIDEEVAEFYQYQNLSAALSRRLKNSDSKVIFHGGQNFQELLVDLSRIDWKINLAIEDKLPNYVYQLLMEDNVSPGYYIIENGLESLSCIPAIPSLALESILLSQEAPQQKFVAPWRNLFINIEINFNEKSLEINVNGKSQEKALTVYTAKKSP